MQDKTKEEVMKHLNTSENGLTNEEAKKRLLEYGGNVLKQAKKKSLGKMIIGQLKDKMIIILLLAAVLSFFLGENAEGVVIVIIVFINAFISIWEEKKATDALSALQKLNAPMAQVLRDGVRISILASELVPGDIVYLEAGMVVPADIRLLLENNLQVDESMLTGESIAVLKDANFRGTEKTPLAEQKNMVFSSTIVTSGTAMGVVYQTGMKTEVGKIAHLLQNTDELDSPLRQKLNKVGTSLSIVGILVSILIFIIGFIQGDNLLAVLMIAISLAISVIPEGLPATAMIVMALGVERMAKKKALVKTLPAVESLGSATYICTDKTGTLTENKMQVVKVLSKAAILENSKEEVSKDLVYAMALCNNASFLDDKIIGDPTEGALLVYLKKKHIHYEEIIDGFTRVFEFPFDSGRKRMTTINQVSGKYIAYTKGATEELLDCCVLKDEEKKAILGYVTEMSEKGIRVLGFAKKEIAKLPKSENDNIEYDLTFLGLVGMMDPPRKEAKEAVRICHEAGIQVVMITGDHLLTAKSIASELGILKDGDLAITGQELQSMGDEEFSEKVKYIRVYARVTPEDKLRIVKTLQANKEIVAMTGDGVNDSPALKMADIGVAMGITGSDVSKEAADMILLDDNFATITVAVREGRRVYRNIEKVIQFLLAGNIAEVLVIFVTMLFNLDSPLMAVHILFINLVTDTFPSLALGVDPETKDSMQKKPRKKDTLFQKGLVFRVLFYGLYLASITFLSYNIGLKQSYGIALTMAFMVLCLSQIFHAFNQHSNVYSLFSKDSPRNPILFGACLVSILALIVVIFVPPIREFFSLSILPFKDWLWIILLSFTPILVVELFKLIRKWVVKKD